MNERFRDFDLGLYSKYRGELMGVAAIMVIASHVYGFGVEMCDPIRRLLGVGASGVELFLFVSGFGLWKSYDDATKGTFSISACNIFPWYKKRYQRILIPYLIFAIPIYGLLTLLDHMDMAEYIKRILFISFWRDGLGLWYVAMLIPLYFVAPFVIRALSGDRKITWLILLVLIAELYAYFAFGGEVDVFFSRFMVSRLPIFFIGVFMGKAICEGKRVSLWFVLIVPLLVYILLYGLNHFAGTRFFYLWLLTMPFSTMLVWLLSRSNWLQVIFKFLGKMSLEIYCTHAFVPLCIIRAFNMPPSLYMYLLGVGISILLSMGINKLSKIIIDKIK